MNAGLLDRPAADGSRGIAGTNLARLAAALPAELRESVVDFADRLPDWCVEFGVVVTGTDDLRLRFAALDGEAVVWKLPQRRGVFRAIMARLAFHCGAAGNADASPYGGRGTFVAGTPPRKFFVEYANTQAEQRFTLKLATD